MVSVRWRAGALILPAIIGCSGGAPSGPPGPDNTITSIAVTTAQSSIQVGNTTQLAAAAKNAAGGSVGGVTFSWSSSNTSIAEVSASGLVTGKAAGSATVTASASGQNGSILVTVTPPPVPVATVTVSAPDTVLQGGDTQLAVSIKDDAGNELTGRAVQWSTSNAAVASVSANGLLTAVTAGEQVTVTATAEGKVGSKATFVKARTATRIAITPTMVTMTTGSVAALTARAWDAANVEIPAPRVTWTSAASGTATVSVGGQVSGAAAGQTTVAGVVDGVSDTAWVAVITTGSLLSTAFAGEAVRADVRPGQAITVPIMLDLSRAASSGDLGAVQLDLAYDTTVFVFKSAATTLGGSAEHHVPTPGTLRFSYANTSPQSASLLTLVTVSFEVRASAPVGMATGLGLTYTARPVSTSFAHYNMPLTFGARLKVVAP